ncbi:uncharacterized protein LOC116337690 isoform X2 [Contarinia nasturtii]|uniref:uncharacterized protein LOC116337690 isoform X2 n=1 Tax=Contarinia nasturtii TaxID=265458 RepID=UPI0012D3CB2E|nr:uncharacterized protein LOC116337690 isoform X2 [Contarinia nasturtii]
MSYNQQNVPVNANFNQNVLNAFIELHIKEEILIKEETHVTEVEGIFNLGGEHLALIKNHDSAVLNIMVELQAAADAMGQPNGISLTNAKAMVRASKRFVKSMKQIFKHVKTYETATQIAPDYDLQDETKISMLPGVVCTDGSSNSSSKCTHYYCHRTIS